MLPLVPAFISKQGGGILPPVPSQATIYATADSRHASGEPAVLPQAAVGKIKAGEIKFYVYGYVEYEDDFTLWSARRPGFCFDFNPKGVNSFFNVCQQRSYPYTR